MAKLSGGTAHTLTPDIKAALSARLKAISAWENLTPLAQMSGFVGLPL
jgi:hypothetical protein